MTVPWVLLRYAVEGIASSRRRLAPRNDNTGDTGEKDRARHASPLQGQWFAALSRLGCLARCLAPRRGLDSARLSGGASTKILCEYRKQLCTCPSFLTK